MALPPAPTLDDDVVGRALAHARDADQPEAERVGAVYALRGAADPFAASRALVEVMNEPLLWLGSEVLACLDPRVAVGVDARGRLAASPTKLEELQRDDDGELFCADLGTRVVPAEHVARLAHELIEKPAWLTAPPHGMAILLVREPGKRQRVVVVGPEPAEATFGRAADCVVVDAPGVARRHARLVLRDSKTIVVDLAGTGDAATPATTLNDRRLSSPMVLREGAVLGVGEARLLVEQVVDGRGPGARVVVGHNRHGVFLGHGRSGVVRYDPPAAVGLEGSGYALGVTVDVAGDTVRFHDELQ